MTYPRCVTCHEIIRTIGDFAIHGLKCKLNKHTGLTKTSYAKRYRR